MTRFYKRSVPTFCTWIALLMTMSASQFAMAKVWSIAASDRLEFDTQNALLSASPGDTIQLPAGRFPITQELSISTPFITLKGAGLDQTTLVYDENAEGAQAIISYADHTSVEDLAIEDVPGDGIKFVGVNGVTVRRVKVEYTRRANPENGGYGLYPVQSSNVLIEGSVVIGASDAGIYVGQSQNIIIRHNRVEYNVAGIEIENSQRADVYQNIARNNTGGILVFNLPNLLVKNGRGTRVFDNFIFENNFKNFAPPGNVVATVPQGTGVLIMATDEVEVFRNTIERHNTVSIALLSYYMTQRPVNDPSYDAVPERIWIHDNVMRKAGALALVGGNQLGLAAAGLSFPHRVPHISYDGIGLPDGEGGFFPANLTGDKRICIGANEHDGGKYSYVGNLQFWKQNWWSPIPGQMDRDFAPFDCKFPGLSPVSLAERPAVPLPDSDQASDEEIDSICQNPVDGINWDAIKVDCPLLSHYNLYTERDDPLSKPRGEGFSYDLTTPLFSDYASKDRVLYLPPGASAAYNSGQVLSLPVGTIIAKTFYFPTDLREPNSAKRLMETRLLIHREKSWKALAYKWNADGSEAELMRGGNSETVSWVDSQGQSITNNYRMPNLAQCEGCHRNNEPIGLQAGYLNRPAPKQAAAQNQLQLMASSGLLRGLPDDFAQVPRYPVWNDPLSGSLADRARTYLDSNCAHCHNPNGRGSTSALFLNLSQAEGINSGICKSPVAAGRASGNALYDIVPGQPEQSILVYRLGSVKAAVKMPELSKTMVHQEGLALVSEWISSLEGDCKKR